MRDETHECPFQDEPDSGGRGAHLVSSVLTGQPRRQAALCNSPDETDGGGAVGGISLTACWVGSFGHSVVTVGQRLPGASEIGRWPVRTGPKIARAQRRPLPTKLHVPLSWADHLNSRLDISLELI